MRRERTDVVTVAAHASPTAVHAHGSRTAVFAYGPQSGPGILAVHGFRGTHHGLEPLAVALASRGFRVFVPDLPGAGESSPLDGRHDAAGYGSWLVELARRLPRPRVLLGHSFGSVVVGSAVAQGAGHDAAVLLNPILTPPLEGPRQVATAAARVYYALAGRLPDGLGRRLLASRSIAGVAGGLMTSTADPALRRWIRREHRLRAGSFASRRVVLEAFAASTTSTVVDFADRLLRPTLVLGADRDPLSPAGACTAEASGIRSGTFHLFPGRGHLLPYEEVGEVARLIASWSREHLPSRVAAG